MTKEYVRNKLNKLSEKYNIAVDIIKPMFWMEYLVSLISESKYKDNFIFKGGFLLASIFGIEERRTKDIDASITFGKEKVTRDKIEVIFKEIKRLAKLDNVDMELETEDFTQKSRDNLAEAIKITFKTYSENEYDSKARLDFVKLDICDENKLIPKEKLYQVKRNINDDIIEIWGYAYETIIAEKIHACCSSYYLNEEHHNSRPQHPRRAKDWVDIYRFWNYHRDEINLEYLYDSLVLTFSKWDREFSTDITIDCIDQMYKNEKSRSSWNAYIDENNIKNITYEEALDSIKEFIKALNR